MRKIFATAAVLLGMANIADAQTIITEETLTHDGSVVTVSFNVDTDVKDLPSNRKEVIMPYIYNGKDTLWMDVMEVYGKGRYKRERQINHINGDKDWELGTNQFMKGQVYSYSAQVPLKRWMKSANLGIRRQIVGCACETELQYENLAEGVALFEEPQMPARRIPEYVIADASRIWDVGHDQMEIIFKVSKIDIDPTVFNNEVVFGRILAAVDKIFTNPAYKMDKIVVAGYASPEGKPGFNNWLGYNRALALVNYIIKNRPQYNLTMNDFQIVNGDENWIGLRSRLLQTEMPNKDKVLAIIDDPKLTGQQKKARIKALDGGRTWKKMLDEIYPHLRSAEYLAVYFDSTEDKAVDIINEANAMIRAGEYAEALEHVMQVQKDPRACNTIGVALMMQGEFEKAMPWLEKALEGDCPSAQHNIDAINAEYEYENDQRTAIEEYLKKFE